MKCSISISRATSLWVALAVAILASGCELNNPRSKPVDPPGHIGYVHVEKTNNGFRLVRGSATYSIKGAGLQIGIGTGVGFGADAKKLIDLLKQSGGNTIRTWSTANAQEVLDYAQSKGMTVMLGLMVVHERQGMNYDDDSAVAAQLAGLCAEVRKYRNHPALLAWGVGNEVETEATNMKVWPAVNDIAAMIHQEDPDHPTAYVVASYQPAVLLDIKRYLTAVDILGVNTYGDIGYCLDAYKAAKMNQPVIVCEWGPTGWWEGPATSWGAYIEPTSGVRAAEYSARYKMIEDHGDMVLGSYAFYWGQKQERTPTWFSLVLDGGLLTESADALQRCWTGEWPAQRAPHVTDITLQGQQANAGVKVASGQTMNASVSVTPADGTTLKLKWQVFTETTATSIGGDVEIMPVEVTELDMVPSDYGLGFTAPTTPGPYRLFVQVLDEKDKVGTANIPFWVE